MKNIGIIINTLQGGGAERCAADLSVYFSDNGYNVYIITDTSTDITYQYKGTLINFILSFTNTAENPLVKKVEELANIKKQNQIDISISFMQFANYLNILSRVDDKVIVTTHSLNSEYAKYEKSIYWSEETFKMLYQYADVITFPSDYCRRDWIEHYGDLNNITRTIYNPVHLMNVVEEREKENVVIAIGRMHGVKRQWHLLKAFKLVKERVPDSRLILLGDGELRNKLKALVEELAIGDSVEMPGNVRKVRDYLAKAKVFTITSRYEAMPCAVLEALSAGVPVVGFDIPGGIREELGIDADKNDTEYPIKGKCGILTPYISEETGNEIDEEDIILANEISNLLLDDASREKYKENALKQVEKFTLSKIGNIWVNDIFKNNLNRKIDYQLFQKIKDYNFSEFIERNETNENMYSSYYRLLEKWMKTREDGKSSADYFEKKGYKRIVIYGLGRMANHLIYDLKYSDVKIAGAIDKAAINKYEEYPVVTLDDNIPEADCVVVTPTYEFNSIRAKLIEKTNVPIISLMDVFK